MRLLFTAVFLLLLFKLPAQEEIKFDKNYYECENKWVVLQKGNPSDNYRLGYIYLDLQAGFTMQLGGKFYINDYNHYVFIPADTAYRVKVRLDPTFKKVALLPEAGLIQMDLPDTPAWAYIYLAMDESPSDLTRKGFFYNHVGASGRALGPLRKAYKLDPATKGLAFELAFAYNALERYDEAEEILREAIKRDPNNVLYYRELGFSLAHNGKLEEAEAIYRKGINLSRDNQQKAEMAVNMAQAYFNEKNKKKYKEWAKITRKYTDRNSEIAKFIRYLDNKI